MKLSDFAKISDENAQALQRKMDRLMYAQKLTFSNVGPLPGCRPACADMSFFKEDRRYCMMLEQPVRYAGDEPAMMHLTVNKSIFFREFGMLLDYLRELPCDESPPEPRDTGAPTASKVPSKPERDLDSIVKTDDVAVPKGRNRRVLDAKVLQRELSKIIMGQDEAVAAISQVAPLHVNKKNPKKPLSIFAYGPSGTGKSELAKALAGMLSKHGPHQYSVSWTDTNTCTEPHSVSRFIGSPPGYVAHESKNAFDLTTENPYVVYIFDEIEKATPELLKILMAALDEGRVASLKELPDHSWAYDFRRCIFVFTSNLQLGAPDQKQIGFSAPAQVEDIRYGDGAVEASYTKTDTVDTAEAATLIQRIYKTNEAARKNFIAQGNLTEVASRINYFVEFKPLQDDAKVRILAKQVIETALEYDVCLTHISASILQDLVDAAMSEKALVRAFKPIIEGYLAPVFSEAGTKHGGQNVRLTGTIKLPVIAPEQ